MSSISELSETMAVRAQALLDCLNPEQRRQANLEFDDEVRRTWYYTPNDRPGLPLAEIPTRAQQYEVFKLLATGLSEPAYNLACSIIGHDNILVRRNAFRDDLYAGRGPESRQRDPNMYFVVVFGEPGGKEPWGWCFSGHHVSVNYTIVDGFVAATPAFFGADPAMAPMPGGRTLRPLAAEEDMALELIAALPAELRARAIVYPKAPGDILQGNRPRITEYAQPKSVPDMQPPHVLAAAEQRNPEALAQRRKELELTPEERKALDYSANSRMGVRIGELGSVERDAFIGLMRLYLDRVPEAISSQYAGLLEAAGLRDTAFAWAGPTDGTGAQYYRIQSERLLIEYDKAGPEANHLHSVWRDTAYDFGGDPLDAHYSASHGA